MKLRLLISLGFLLIVQDILAQLPGASVLDNTPTSTKWEQIKSPHFKVIYPEGFEDQAQRTTNILEHIYEPASNTLGKQPRRFPIVLQNQLSNSNGFVTVAPYRSELYTMAPQDYRRTGNDYWLEYLIAHEYRHMVQFEKAVTPFNKFVYALTGELGAGAMAAIAVPSWFFEGDAVGLETSIGHTGRGRNPSFLMPFKANTLEKGGFDYYKQHLTSFKDFVPNHYVTGYLMTTHLKNKYGPHIWDGITERAFRRPFVPFTFSNAIKKETGKYLVPTYDEMFAEQKSLYKEQVAKIQPTKYEVINRRSNKDYTHYRFPQPVLGGKVLVIKSGMGDIVQFVLLEEDGTEETIYNLGQFNNPAYLSANEAEVVWCEFEPDLRWRNRNYSVIKKMDLESTEIKRLTSKTRYSSAAISKNGKLVIATEQTEETVHSLHLLDARSGELIKVFDNPKNEFYTMPTFDVDDKSILVLKHVDEGKQIIQKSIDTGEERILLFTQKENIGHPVASSKHIFYNSTFNGIDNIYAIDRSNLEIYQVTNSVYGAFNASLSEDENELIYNDYAVDGHEAVKAVVDPSKWTPLAQVQNLDFGFEKTMVENEDIRDVLYNYPNTTHDTKKYNVLLNSLRPISWAFGNLTFGNEIGVGLSSQDLLSTSSITLGGTYNTAEKAWGSSATLSYQRLYPIIDIGIETDQRSVEVVGDPSLAGRYYWNENSGSVAIRLPLERITSSYTNSLTIESEAEYTRITNFEVPEEVGFLEGEELYSISHSLTWSRIQGTSTLQLGTRWGQMLTLNSMQTPAGSDYQSTLLAAEGRLFFPGLHRHHSIQLVGGYQYQDNENYQFSSPQQYTRGYAYTAFDDYISFSGNYRLPLMYMDFHLGPMINFQRLYANLFYDHALGISLGEPNQALISVGAEVYANFNIMRFLPLLGLGVRAGYMPESGEPFFGLLVAPVSF